MRTHHINVTILNTHSYIPSERACMKWRKANSPVTFHRAVWARMGKSGRGWDRLVRSVRARWGGAAAGAPRAVAANAGAARLPRPHGKRTELAAGFDCPALRASGRFRAAHAADQLLKLRLAGITNIFVNRHGVGSYQVRLKQLIIPARGFRYTSGESQATVESATILSDRSVWCRLSGKGSSPEKQVPPEEMGIFVDWGRA